MEAIKERLRESEPFKIEFIDDNDDYYKLDSFIKGVFAKHMLIEFPTDGETYYDIPKGSEINLNFKSDFGILVAQCTILGTDEGEGIRLAFPSKVKEVDRREYIRMPLRLKIEVSFLPEPHSAERQTYMVMTRNISANGLSYIHSRQFKEGYDIKCKMHLNDSNPKPVELECRYIYSKPVVIRDETNYLTAFTYTKISSEDTSRIIKECFNYQIKRKHA
jgi:c-di-GMP-binding flagellar brake protein YcgR